MRCSPGLVVIPSSKVVASEALRTRLCLALNGLTGTLLVLAVIVGETYHVLITFMYASQSPETFLDNIDDDPELGIVQAVSEISSALDMLLPGFSPASGILKVSLRQLIVFEIPPGIANIDQVVDLVYKILIDGFDVAGGTFPNAFKFFGINTTGGDGTRLTDENILPQLRHSIGLQGGCVGSKALFFTSDFVCSNEVAVTDASDGVADPNSPYETGIGDVIESLVSLSSPSEKTSCTV